MSVPIPPQPPAYMPYSVGPYYDHHHHHNDDYRRDDRRRDDDHGLQFTSVNKNIADGIRDLTSDVVTTSRLVSDGVVKTNDTVVTTGSNIRGDVFNNYKGLSSEITSVDRNVSNGVCKVSDVVNASGASIRGDVSSGVMNIRDSLDRNGIATSTYLTTLSQASSDRDRDILQAIEKNAGEARYNYSVLSATDRQAANDLARDGMQQTYRGITEVLTAVDRNGTAIMRGLEGSGYETRTLINSTNNDMLRGLCHTKGELSQQASSHYASLLLEGQKVKECLSVQMAESKYEALKNKEQLSAQLAASSCEAKYEALKNTQMLSTQLAECCCELKEKVCGVSSKIDDTVRTLDSQRVRDALGVANNELNLLKVMDAARCGSYRRCRSRSRSPERH